MMTKQLLMTTLLTAGLLGGCAAMSEDECRAGDWYSAGLKDGERGQRFEYFYDRKKACQEYGVSASTTESDQWNAGYFEGVKLFCAPDRAYDRGLSGKDDPNVCGRSEQDALFKINYALGQQVYLARRHVDTLRDTLNGYRDELEAGTRNSGAETRPMTDNERADWRNKIDAARRDLEQARYELRTAERASIQWQ